MKDNHITQPEHWEEWFEQCALAKCSSESQKSISSFAYLRYSKYLKRALSEKKQSLVNAPPEIFDLLETNTSHKGVGLCWHDLEASVWMRDKPTESKQKTYKKYYRSQAHSIEVTQNVDEARNFLEGAVTKNLILSRCRNILVGALFQNAPSSDENEPNTDRSFSLLGATKEIQPPVGTPLDQQENEQLAEQIFKSLPDEEKFLIYAFYNELTLNAPIITDFFNRKKSALYEKQRQVLQSLREKITMDDLNSIENHNDLLRVLEHLTEKLRIWIINPECSYAPLIK